MPNTTIQSNQSQHPPLTPDRAKAALGNATLLQSFLLPKAQQPQEQPQTPGNTPQTPQEEKPKETGKKGGIEEVKASMELEMNKKLDDIRKEMKEDSQRELDQIKELITSALAEEDKNEPDKTEKPA